MITAILCVNGVVNEAMNVRPEVWGSGTTNRVSRPHAFAWRKNNLYHWELCSIKGVETGLLQCKDLDKIRVTVNVVSSVWETQAD